MNLHSKGHITKLSNNLTKSVNLHQASAKKELAKPSENKSETVGTAFQTDTNLKDVYQLFTAVRSASCTAISHYNERPI